MIQAASPVPSAETQDRWQDALRNAVRSVEELAALLELAPGSLDAYQPATGEFELLVPRAFVARMRKGDPADPLLRQVLPHRAERLPVPGFSDDPLREAEVAAGGVLRKYPRRALLIASGACPVHCRYCFRRAFPYGQQLAARAEWQPAVAALAAVPHVKEVILSGGDPLSLSNGRLRRLMRSLNAAGSIECVRIHTRFPIMVPERIDEGLCRTLRDVPLKKVVVVHVNHANELDGAVQAGLGRLRGAADWLLNQSVLLRGVNDDVDALTRLSERLFECDVLPYYMHLLDPVTGAAHFDVDQERGRQLLAQLRERLPGYLVPRLVREVPGELSKTPIP